MDPNKLAKQVQQMQNKMMKAQEELANETVTATAGGGAVTVEMNGHHAVTAVKIDPAAVDPDDVEMLQDMVLTAFNEALEKAQDLQQRKMSAITGGMNIPGLF
ncbi:MAG: nucleoid-associated protein EbfC [Chloroflexia bacterium]|jgi:DNA-binding YbaB/EbfC family protein|nr:nucleoid-associated protein EbfC [Chloroflexia bacterium]